jgi:hypothetical protein
VSPRGELPGKAIPSAMNNSIGGVYQIQQEDSGMCFTTAGLQREEQAHPRIFTKSDFRISDPNSRFPSYVTANVIDQST